MNRALLSVCLLLAGMAVMSPVCAETTIQKVPPCAPVYGTWRTAHIMDKFGNPQPLAPSPGWEGLIMEARIDKDKAVLVWFGGKKKMTFKRWYRYPQTDFEFGGLSSNGGYIGVATEFETVIEYPSDRCYLDMWYFLRSDAVGSLDHHLLMEKIE
ncbi:hypothetical protein [Magnetospirillum sp. UT-4]|uniref:hypothetical protein n=1 Tax=Magnetospirillum sp. UT-4 TaxID=2681467 RepID=UPI00137D1184|nr:hypothetical protein [Magnetospirillum sp. UT-4]CAA7617617.1 conserved exported hypothetical protein [Magnetospirillum sp. UT-4]